MRSVVFSLFFGGVDGKLFEKVFVDAADQIFFFTKSFVADFVNLVYHRFDILGGKVTGCKGALHKTTFQLFVAECNAVQGRVECYIQLRSRRIDNGRPACFDGQIIGAICKGCIVEKRRSDLFIVRVEALGNQCLAKMFHAIFKFLPDETQKHKRKHHVTLFKEGTGIACLAQDVAAVKKNCIQVQRFFCFLFGHGEYLPFGSIIEKGCAF